MSRLTRDGTAEPVSRDQILRRERGREMLIFPVQLRTTSRIGNLTWLIYTFLAICVTIHTSFEVHTKTDVKNPARGHKVEKHLPEGKKKVSRTLHVSKRKRHWDKNTRKSDMSKETNKRNKKQKTTQTIVWYCMWLSGRMHIE